MKEGTVILKPGKEKPVLRHHPWIFSGAIARVEGAEPGGVVVVRAHDGRFLARGYYNPRSQIRVRLLTWDEQEQVDAYFWLRRVAEAWNRRDEVVVGDATAWRAVHAESDGLPGLVVDVYERWLVVQVLTLGIERALEYILPALVEVAHPAGIFERSDVDVRKQEGLTPRSGHMWGDPPPEYLAIREGGYTFWVDVQRGQKTGFYLDQRVNRARVTRYAAGREVLNAFSYTGAFAVYALGNGAVHVVNLDASADALHLAERNLVGNGFGPDMWTNVQGDVFQALREYRQAGRTFDMIILDPPKFATHRRSLERAARGYKDINLLAFQLLAPGGILATFSCSGRIDADLFQKIVFGASVDAGVEGQILAYLDQAPDHPVRLSFPEGRYLKGLLVRKEE
ncbi:MAG: class I SAM-dependent rRNA methyltransferase [Chloroflexi bacterium]|nr:class I SAM-dependent rRNA methyltransferase [Chloroflexota bacterium]